MSAEVRDYQERDEQCIVELSLRAWEPVFEAISDMLGPELFAQLRGDWRATQATAVREALDAAAH